MARFCGHRELLVVVSLVRPGWTAKRTPVEVIASCFGDSPPAPAYSEAALSAAGPQNPSRIDIAFFDTRPKPDTGSMERAARRCQSTGAEIRFHAILRVQREVPGFRVTLLTLPPKAQCLYDGMRRLSHGPGPHYLYKPLLHYVMPMDVHRLILLDTDVVVVRDIAELQAEFGRFGTALIGVGNEQSNLYGKHNEGKNGGVQLLDLRAMRASAEYAAVLDKIASGRDGRRIGYLGDQTLYSFLAKDYRHLFHTLPCEWNRQLSAHFGFANATVHACPRRCGIMHANFAPFKCIAWSMQASPSCSTWKEFNDKLLSPPSPTHTCPKAAAMTREKFKLALARYFPDCCVPDANFADALGSATVEAAATAKEIAVKAAFDAMRPRGRRGFPGKQRGHE